MTDLVPGEVEQTRSKGSPKPAPERNSTALPHSLSSSSLPGLQPVEIKPQACWWKWQRWWRYDNHDGNVTTMMLGIWQPWCWECDSNDVGNMTTKMLETWQPWCWICDNHDVGNMTTSTLKIPQENETTTKTPRKPSSLFLEERSVRSLPVWPACPKRSSRCFD